MSCTLSKKPSVGNFEPLFNKSVPHVLESIFFSLDTDSFAACGKVCKSWNELISSRAYQEKLEKMLEEKKRKEENLCSYSDDGNADGVRKLLVIKSFTTYLNIRKVRNINIRHLLQ